MILDYLSEFNSTILGINYRNQELIRKLNPKPKRKIADNKLMAKKIFSEHKIPTPAIYRIIKTERDIEKIDWEQMPKSFVIKPTRGTQGKGIKVLYGKKKGKLAWIAADGRVYTPYDLSKHLSDILTGRFSLGHKRDTAYIEERIKIHPTLKPYSYKGIPDIRIIVYKGIPLMAELRLPTRKAKGTANLHAGGIAVGIDMATGITTTAIQRKGVDFVGDRYTILETTPEPPHLPLRGIQIPYWTQVLEIAAKIYKIVELGYLGVDIAIDREKGPVLLEINARPGLGIQVANQAGLLERINRVKGMKVKTVTKAIRIAQTLFGGEIEEEVEQLTGRQIIGIIETITVYPNPLIKKKRLKPEKIKAKIDTGALYSSLDYQLALRLGYTFLEQYHDLIKTNFPDINQAKEIFRQLKEKYPEDTRPELLEHFSLVKSGSGFTIRPTVRIPVKIADEKKEILFTITDRSSLNYNAIIGRKDLKGFLIDPARIFGRPKLKLNKNEEN